MSKYVYRQLVDLLPHRVFDRIVEKYQGNKYANEPNVIEEFFQIDNTQKAQQSTKDDVKEAAKIVGNALKENAKQIVSDAKTIFSTLVK